MNKIENTVILVDYDNVFITLENNYRDFRNPNIMYDVICKIKERYIKDNVICSKLFADFQKLTISDSGYETLRNCNVNMEYVFGGKNASDVVLMIDCIKLLSQYPHIDKFVLVSSDSDIMPIFKETQLFNKQLEVIYCGVNVSPDYVAHMKTIGITNISIESIMNINVTRNPRSLDELYLQKTKDRAYFEKLLNHINESICITYEKYLRTDWHGNIISVGSSSAATITAYLREFGVCPERELRKELDDKLCPLLAMLISRGILMYHEYRSGRKLTGTYILCEQFLDEHGYYVDGLMKKSDYSDNI